jgi:calcineurin-like phosphoesterase family protein
MRWWTADLHLGHANICSYTGRPYHSLDAMNEALIEKWNSRVGEVDEVYVLGDLAMGHIGETLPLAGLLNGSKVLVPGNHDRCWDGLRRKRNDSIGGSGSCTATSTRSGASGTG